MDGPRALVFLVSLLLLSGSVGAQTVEDISAPNKVPDMSYFKTRPDTIEPGASGKLNFTLTNRYEDAMENATLVVDIYKWATIDEAKEIKKIDRAPTFKEGQAQRYEISQGTMQPGVGYNMVITIQTKDDTPEGTYFVRTMMDFDYHGANRVMRSRGHFTNAQWEAATDEINLNQSVGGINITLLGVDGILVDTSFSVKKPMPMWPLAVLIGLTVLFAALAVVFYLVEEEKGHTKLKKAFFPQAGKVQQRKMLLERDLKKRRKGKKGATVRSK
jgi:hypothetical protein